MSRSGNIITAPVPSPKAIPASITGSRRSSLISLSTAGSFPLWEGIKYCTVPGTSLSASNAAVILINPSRTTGTWKIPPPIQTPASPAISNPPTVSSIFKGFASYSLYFSIASVIICLLWRNFSSQSPAPLPVTSSALHPKSDAAMALLVVVFPIPISPVARM